jgi:hypothetical protein
MYRLCNLLEVTVSIRPFLIEFFNLNIIVKVLLEQMKKALFILWVVILRHCTILHYFIFFTLELYVVLLKDSFKVVM